MSSMPSAILFSILMLVHRGWLRIASKPAVLDDIANPYMVSWDDVEIL